MVLGRAWRWAVSDFKKGLAALDPSKLMIAPILLLVLMAVLDRAIYEFSLDMGLTTPRVTRLSSLTPPAATEPWRANPSYTV